jgi:amino acid transporter
MREKSIVFTREASGLVRELSFFDVFAWVIATPAASGITFYAVSTAAKYPGASIPLAFAIGLVIFFPIYALMGIMSATLPRSGSLYVAVSRVLGPSIGFICAWLFFIGYGISIGVLGYIAVGIMGGVFTVSGAASGNHLLILLGESLEGPFWKTIGGFLWVFLFWAIALLGIRWVRNAMRILFVLPLLATFIGILYCFTIGPQNVANAFDHIWGHGVYNSIIESAKAHGWKFPSFSWANTLGALLVVIWAFTGGESISYASGEVKTPRTTLLKGYLAGFLGVGILYIIVAFATYYPYKDFIGAYVFLYEKHQDVLKTIMPAITPSVPFFISSLMGNVWFGVIISLGITLWYINTIPPLFTANSRLLFALAMDRALPEKIADLNIKRGAPTWASHITAIVALMGVLLMWQNVGVVLGVLNFTVFFILWAFGLSALLLPYTRPEIYLQAPLSRKWLMQLLGLLTFGEGWFFVLFSAMEFTKGIAFLAALIMTIGVGIYLLQLHKNKEMGIDITKIYSQIPPE